MGVAAFEARGAFDGAVLGEIRGEADEQFAAEIGVGDFASAELHDGFHAVAFLEEADGVVLFEIVIVVIGVGAELELLHLDDVLFAFGFVLLLFVFVLPLAVVHRFGDGRLGGGGDQDEVEA